MRFTLILFIAISLAACGEAHIQPSSTTPNIILITADDLGWKDLGSYGNRDISTPNIDKLAEGGVKFTNAFVVAPSCASSRAALITGQYPHTNGVTALTHRHPSKSLMPFYTTLPNILAKRGYRTAIDGKWHVAPFFPVSWYGYKERLFGAILFKDAFLILNADDATGFINDSVEMNQAFYLELNFVQTHRVEDGRFYFSDKFPVDVNKITVPRHHALPNWPEIREDIARYYSQTMEMDAIIGEIVARLGELKIRDNTLIVFVSDNGQPYPGAKMTLYDRGIGTPLIVNWPGTLKAATQDALISSIDIMPTLLQAANIETPKAVQGLSFFPLLSPQAQQKPYEEREAVFSELDYHVNYLPGRSIRTKEWKYIRNYSPDPVGLDELDTTDWAQKLAMLPDQPWLNAREEEELYYLSGDPDEKDNLVNDTNYRSILDNLRRQLDTHLLDSQDPLAHKSY